MCGDGHLWVLGGVDLRMTGASAWWQCQVCGEIDSKLSANEDYVADAVSERSDGAT